MPALLSSAMATPIAIIINDSAGSDTTAEGGRIAEAFHNLGAEAHFLIARSGEEIAQEQAAADRAGQNREEMARSRKADEPAETPGNRSRRMTLEEDANEA